MPSRNTIKAYSPYSYYHVYNRGVAKQAIFHDADDKKHFLRIIARHLDPDNDDKRYDGMAYTKFCSQLELLSYCLMGNHFHMLLYMDDSQDSIKQFMQSLCTSYSMYYNKKYNRVGPLFQGVFKASLIDDESYLLHITRYIHLNPRNYKTYFYSSYKNYIGKSSYNWLKIDRIAELFTDSDEYIRFVEDYEDYKSQLEDLEPFLANR